MAFHDRRGDALYVTSFSAPISNIFCTSPQPCGEAGLHLLTALATETTLYARGDQYASISGRMVHAVR